ncbi:MAG: hypothetical protein HOJ76_08355, partial [Proteobacteria bacterium]|nr:hypothetical protein [Pseudomonadota bacterium]
TVQGADGADDIDGSEGDDLLFGADGADVIDGNLGADTIDGGLGDDTINGGIGNDVLSGGISGSLTETAPGAGDWVFIPDAYWAHLADGDDTLAGGLGDDIFIAWFGDDQITVGGNAVQDYQAAYSAWNGAVSTESAKKGIYDSDIATTNGAKTTWDTAEGIESSKYNLYTTASNDLQAAIDGHNAAWQGNETAQGNLTAAQGAANSSASTLSAKTSAKNSAQQAYDAALASQVDGGFENNSFGDWSYIGSASVKNNAATASDGNYYAELISQPTSKSNIASYLEISSGNSVLNGGTEGSAIKTTMNLPADVTVTFDWDFINGESPSSSQTYQDFAFVVADGNALTLASTINDYPGWQTYSYTTTFSGEHIFGLGVMNEQDKQVESRLRVDNFKITGGSQNDVTAELNALNAAIVEYNTAVTDTETAQGNLTAAIGEHNAAASALAEKTTAKDSAQTANDDAYTHWQNAKDGADEKEELYDDAKEISDVSHAEWQTAINTTAQLLTTRDNLEPLQHQTDELLIPETFTLTAAELDLVTGDLSISYTTPGGTELFALEHSVTIADHLIDPIDVITLDIDGDGILETFEVAGQFTADTDSNTLIVGSENSSGETLVGAGGDDWIIGNDGDDTIFGADGDDTIDGGAGADTITGGTGDDDIEGGSGSDTVVFAGNKGDFTFAVASDGTLTVTDEGTGNTLGVDTVSGVETLSFADGDLTVTTLAGGAVTLTGSGVGD